jgi:hypothetical protein
MKNLLFISLLLFCNNLFSQSVKDESYSAIGYFKEGKVQNSSYQAFGYYDSSIKTKWVSAFFFLFSNK